MNGSRWLIIFEKMKLTEKIKKEFNKLRMNGVLFKTLMYGTPDYTGENRDVFPEYASGEKIPFGEAFETINRAETRNDFGYTQLKYKVYEAYRDTGLKVDHKIVVNFATGLISALAIEDMDNMLREYEQMIIGIGKDAVKPLQDFIATEGKKQAKEHDLYPVKENYDAARRVLSKIISS